jgi:RNA-directed DNA polymerase
LGNLTTPKRVQKLQMALHAKAKAEAGYRFYALYDKISREDILAHAYAQCRSNKGAPGVDGQDFADIEAHGVERWLAELALALRQETGIEVAPFQWTVCQLAVYVLVMAACMSAS